MGKGVLWPHECEAARDRNRDGESFDDLAERYNVGYRTIRRHVRGRCNCGHDTPAIPLEPTDVE
jgi:hypothetical protein